MKISKLHNLVPFIVLGTGVAVMIMLWNMGSSSPKTHLSPQADVDERPSRDIDLASSNNSYQPSGRQPHVAIAFDMTSYPDDDVSPVTAESNTAKDVQMPREEPQIYTMDTLPQVKSGIYWVMDSDGNVNQIAVDVPDPDSPVGL